MGGYGSGRTGGWPTVEGCRSLVLSVGSVMHGINKALRRLNMPAPSDDQPLTLGWHASRWARSGESEPWAEIEMRLELRAHSGTAWLRYDIDHATRPTGPQHYAVSMVTTPCRFGGQRWWWICPATRRPVSKLYLPNGGQRFLSRGRGAYGLGYASQQQGATDRMHERSRKLYAKLGAEYDGNCGRLPPKPKGMHWRTYEAICDRLAVEADGLNNGLVRAIERLTRRYGLAGIAGAPGGRLGR
jgi:hypothetical protein